MHFPEASTQLSPQSGVSDVVTLPSSFSSLLIIRSYRSKIGANLITSWCFSPFLHPYTFMSAEKWQILVVTVMHRVQRTK